MPAATVPVTVCVPVTGAATRLTVPLPTGRCWKRTVTRPCEQPETTRKYRPAARRAESCERRVPQASSLQVTSPVMGVRLAPDVSCRKSDPSQVSPSKVSAYTTSGRISVKM